MQPQIECKFKFIAFDSSMRVLKEAHIGASYRTFIDGSHTLLSKFVTFGIKIYPIWYLSSENYLPSQTIPSKKVMISRIFIHFIIIFFFSPSLRPNRSQNPKRKQLQQKRKRKMTLRRRKKPQKKRKIQMRNRLHPRPRKRGVDLQLKPPLKRNRHLKRNPNMKNASVHLNFQKVRQKATLAMRKNSKVVTLNQTRGSTKPRNLPVEGFVGQQQKNGKGVDPIPQGTTTVVLLLVRIFFAQ